MRSFDGGGFLEDEKLDCRDSRKASAAGIFGGLQEDGVKAVAQEEGNSNTAAPNAAAKDR